MTDHPYPVREIKDRAACADRGTCPDCGAPLTRCDGSLVHPAGTGLPAWRCTAPACTFVCIH